MTEKYLQPNSSLIEAMEKITESANKCTIVVNKHNKLLGTISDGDIRKVLIKKQKLNINIKNIYKKNCYFVTTSDDEVKINELFENKSIDILPVIKKKKIIVKIINKNQKNENKKFKNILENVPTIIFAGGLGNRLKPISSVIPKPLVPIGDKPIIEHIMERFYKNGSKKFYLLLGYKSKLVSTFLSDFKKFNAKFIYEKKPLGTAGSLSKFSSYKYEDYFVTNCDIVTNENLINFYKFHKKNKSHITLMSATKKITIPYGVVELNKQGNFNKMNEKPDINFLVNTGIYLVNSKVIKLVKKNRPYNFDNLLRDGIKKKLRIFSYPISDNSWIDIGDGLSFLNNQNTLERFVLKGV